MKIGVTLPVSPSLVMRTMVMTITLRIQATVEAAGYPGTGRSPSLTIVGMEMVMMLMPGIPMNEAGGTVARIRRWTFLS